MYARMVIGEANSEEQVQEFARIYSNEVLPELEKEPGFASARLMVEEDGRMAVSLTLWKTREDCVHYHSSKVYRQFVARTQHLLIGDFVVKFFRVAGKRSGGAPPDSRTPGNQGVRPPISSRLIFS